MCLWPRKLTLCLAVLASGCLAAEPLINEATIPAPTLTPATMTSPPSEVPTATATDRAPTDESKTLTICMNVPVSSLLPYTEDALVVASVMQAIYDGPIDHLRDGYHPVILEKLPRIEDGDAEIRQVTVKAGDRIVNADGEVAVHEGPDSTMPQIVARFRLKAGLRWSDGQPLTAHDSIFAYQSVTDPGVLNYHGPNLSLRRELFERTASYRALDDLTTEWSGLPGDLDPEYFTRFFTPMPRHHLEGRRAVEFLTDTYTPPIGWGPFRIVEWDPNLHMILERNPFYFRASEGLPRVDRLVFSFSDEWLASQPAGPVDYSSLARAVGTGRCDIASQDPGSKIPLEVWQEHEPEVKLYRLPYSADHLLFNVDRPSSDVRPEFFADRRVRAAFAHCVNRTNLAAAVPAASGQDELPLSLSSENPAPYDYDPDRGRALLAEAGWSDTEGDGVLDRDGVAFEVSLIATPFRQPVAELIREHMAGCGVRLTLESLDSGELFARDSASPLFGRRFDLALVGRLALEQFCEIWRSDQIPSETSTAEFPSNFGGYNSPEFDAACEAYRQGIMMAERRQAEQDLIGIFARDLPSLPLFWRDSYTGARPEVIGFALDPFGFELWNVEEIDLQD